MEAGEYVDYRVDRGIGSIIEEANGTVVIRVRSKNGGKAQIYAKIGGRARIGDWLWTAASLSNVDDLQINFPANSS